jgi:hypothetical protein
MIRRKSLSIIVAILVVFTLFLDRGYGKDKSIITHRSWDVILSDKEIGAQIDPEGSLDLDFLSGKALWIGGVSTKDRDSKSSHKFIFNSTESVKMSLTVEIFKTVSAAKMETDYKRYIHLTADTITLPSKGNLKRYDTEDNKETRPNPFKSKEIKIDSIGDDSFCYEWVSSRIVFRIKNVYVEVHSSCPYDKDRGLKKILEIARMQEQKINKLLRF